MTTSKVALSSAETPTQLEEDLSVELPTIDGITAMRSDNETTEIVEVGRFTPQQQARHDALEARRRLTSHEARRRAARLHSELAMRRAERS